VLFDLNNFKQINDRFGHPAGDQVLKVFAERLGEAIREVDLAARRCFPSVIRCTCRRCCSALNPSKLA
jgi:hypothetical protein